MCMPAAAGMCTASSTAIAATAATAILPLNMAVDNVLIYKHVFFFGQLQISVFAEIIFVGAEFQTVFCDNAQKIGRAHV